MKAYVTPHEFPNLQSETECMLKLGGELEVITSDDPELIAHKVKDADAIFVQYTRITQTIIEQMQRCKIILRYGIGFDNVDLKSAGEKGIYVCNVPHYCGDEVADHTMALLLAAARKLIPVHNGVSKGKWTFMEYTPIYSLSGKVLGLLGCGKIAQKVAKRAQAFGMLVVAYDPWFPKDEANRLDIKLLDLTEMCSVADVISLHLPLSDQTYHIVNKDLMKNMKDGVILVNTSRGGLVDTGDLKAALDQRKVAVAGLDVVEEEPLDARHPLVGHEQVILTPHNAYYSEESLPRLQRFAAEEVYRVLSGHAPHYPVNKQWMKANS